MIKVGQFNKLKVVKEVPFGLYLEGKEWGDILLPNKFVPEGAKIGDLLDVFVYFDSDDKIIATTQRPRVQLGHCAFLKVIDVNRVGAFLDWGLDKDLLVPVPEQQKPMEQGKSYIVCVKLDNKGRIIASSKLDHFLDKTPLNVQRGDEVSLLLAERTDLGNKVIINNSHWGLIHKADIFQPLNYGRRMTGYIKTVRDDGKVDVVLRKLGHNNILDLATRILDQLQQKDGFLPIHDKSSAEEIMRTFGDSKKSFKSAIGQLYKEGIIQIEDNGIRLRNKTANKR
ncbi:S1 RNA-binding domain-containing protein [Legionella worsleiensis]|nr:S1-like domain-containing RNA-binding protein [Legionella worsleiensis]